jgi:hypothetical protein
LMLKQRRLEFKRIDFRNLGDQLIWIGNANGISPLADFSWIRKIKFGTNHIVQKIWKLQISFEKLFGIWKQFLNSFHWSGEIILVIIEIIFLLLLY